MIVTCQECEASFNVDDSLVKASGSKVKCSKCENVFVVYPPTLSDVSGLEEPLDGFDEDFEGLQSFAEDETDVDDLDLPELDSIFGEDDDAGLEEIAAEASDELDIGDDAIADLEESTQTDLPDLEDIMDFDEDADVDELSDDEPGELELDIDDDFESDQDAEPDEIDIETDEAELDLLDAENLLDDEEVSVIADEADQMTDEFELDVDAADTDDELDLGFDLEDDISEPAAEDELSDELDLSDLEDLIDSDEAPESVLQAEAADEDLDLDLDLDDESAEPAAETEQIDDLDLSDLEDLEFDSDEALQTSDEAEATADELDLDLDFDTESSEPETEMESVDELDLSDLEEMIDSDEALASEPEAEELDLDFDLDDESAEPTAAAAEADDLELDLPDLEDDGHIDETPTAEALIDDTSEEPELDLELDFDADEESQAPAAAAAPEAGDELDFSDLGDMLAGDEEPVSEISAGDSPQELDLDLDLDLDLEPDTAAEETAATDLQVGGGDEEFLDIEKMLEESEEAAAETETETEFAEDALDLDLDFEGELQEEDVLDISESAEDDLEFNLLESDEAALQEDIAELDSSDLRQVSATTDGLTDSTDDFDIDTDGFTDTRNLDGETDIIDGAPAPLPPVKRKSGARKPVLVFAVFFILLGAVLIIPQNLGLKIPFLSDVKIPYISDVKIPYVYDKFNGPRDDAGNLRITPLESTITYQFVDNPKAGTLFVIKGRLKNEYDHPRSYIRVTGTIYKKGNIRAKMTTVYGGNLLSQKELGSLDMVVIKRRLLNKAGNKKSNLKVRTGRVVPFMVVFDKLPNNLDEYTIEVAGSSS
jgi:predicted Zn finger-like uncharacterized protein